MWQRLWVSSSSTCPGRSYLLRRDVKNYHYPVYLFLFFVPPLILFIYLFFIFFFILEGHSAMFFFYPFLSIFLSFWRFRIFQLERFFPCPYFSWFGIVATG